MPRVDAIDISHYQSISSFSSIKSAGVVGVFQKCTEGTTYYDSTYGSRYPQALDAGLKWGAYHFLKHGNVPQQMDWFLSKAKLPSGSRVAIDYEDSACTLTDLQQAIESISGKDSTLQICVYCGGLLKGQVSSTGDYSWLSPYPLWLAQYTSGTPTWPKNIWPQWTLWQYTDQGKVSGISGAVDLNTFNGSPENCAKWFGPTEVVPVPPPPPPVEPVVAVALTVPDGVEVSISVNGQQVMGKSFGDRRRMQAGEG